VYARQRLPWLIYYGIVLTCTVKYFDSLPASKLFVSKSMFEKSLSQQLIFAWGHAIRTWATLSLAYGAVAVLTSLIGLYEPKDWPDVFGSWTEAYTVRNFWGKTWHQFLRRPLATQGHVVVRTLGLKKGTFASKYAQLYVAFFWTAASHCTSAYLVSGSDFGEWKFFLYQAVAIMLEDHIVDAAKTVGLQQNRFWKGIGFAWVFAWFSYSLRLYVDKPGRYGLFGVKAA
jgi:hypothetical protein